MPARVAPAAATSSSTARCRASLLEEALTGEPGIESALIVGSWAARYHGEPGPPPGDVDLVVMGEPYRDAVIEKVAEASRLLARQVHFVHVRAE
jgi:hypothetical protein